MLAASKPASGTHTPVLTRPACILGRISTTRAVVIRATTGRIVEVIITICTGLHVDIGVAELAAGNGRRIKAGGFIAGSCAE
jgi:hypothetical protein